MSSDETATDNQKSCRDFSKVWCDRIYILSATPLPADAEYGIFFSTRHTSIVLWHTSTVVGENRCWCLVDRTSLSSTFHQLIWEDEMLWQHRSVVGPTYLDSRWRSELLLTASTVDVCHNTICLVLKNMPYSASAGSGVGVKRELWGVFVLVLSRRVLQCWMKNMQLMVHLDFYHHELWAPHLY